MYLPFKKYIEENFNLENINIEVFKNRIFWYGIDLEKVIEKFGTPSKIFFLPAITENILRAKEWFYHAIKKHNYHGRYIYSYCSKSNHFSFVVETALNFADAFEISSAYDSLIIEKLLENEIISNETMIICNGFKNDEYLLAIRELYQREFKNVFIVIDSMDEIEALKRTFKNLKGYKIKLGIRIEIEETPDSDFYSSRHGIPSNKIIPLYEEKIKNWNQSSLEMIHFMIPGGIKDTPHFWNELSKGVELFCKLKKKCDDLKYLNIGGGLPYPDSLSFSFNYQKIISEIVETIKSLCLYHEVPEPDIITEFGSYTVATSAVSLLKVLGEKKQNERENWYIVDSSFITLIPDNWALKKRFICLPVNNWYKPIKKVILGGLSCDNMDFYSESLDYHQIVMPSLSKRNKLYIALFFTGAYQDNIAGFGGLKHCLLPSPAILIASKTKNKIKIKKVIEKQSALQMIKLLGYRPVKKSEKICLSNNTNGMEG